MDISSLRKTAVALAVAGTFSAAGVPQAEANIVNLSWRGAFTQLTPTGSVVSNSPSDYSAGFYANGDGVGGSYGAPYFPDNVGPGATPSAFYSGAFYTAHGWYGNRTPLSGTLSFDTSTGAGVGTVNPFFFFGDTPGSGMGTNVARTPALTFQVIDTLGTLVGSMVFSWNADFHSVSIVMDASGMLANLGALTSSEPTTSLSGVGALPATDGISFGPVTYPFQLPLGPSPVATTTLNTGAGCDGLTLAAQVNAYTITPNIGNISVCTTGMTDDGIGGDPMTSAAFSGFNANFDITSVYFDSFVTAPASVPVPAAVWLFGSGLLGLAGFLRRKRSD